VACPSHNARTVQIGCVPTLLPVKYPTLSFEYSIIVEESAKIVWNLTSSEVLDNGIHDPVTKTYNLLYTYVCKENCK
jgi:hypothetical protein